MIRFTCRMGCPNALQEPASCRETIHDERGIARMEHVEALERALAYMEAHLDEEIDLALLASQAGYSLYHFHRLFQDLVGDSLKEYIRKRRLTEAAKELVKTRKPIIDIAFAHGYQSREAFSRAFVQAYGITPAACRKQELHCEIREPMSVNAMLFSAQRASDGLSPLFRKLPERLVAGQVRTFRADGTNLQQIPFFWQEWMRDECWRQLPSGRYANECVGIIFPTETLDFDYLIGFEVDPALPRKPGVSYRKLEPGLFACFTVIGPYAESVQKTWNYIYTRWLPVSDYQHGGREDIELYLERQGEKITELMIPVELRS